MRIERNGKTYVYDVVSPGYYGVIVPPGSPEDNTMGKVGIHWEYLQYAPETDLVKELRGMSNDFLELEQEENKQREERELTRLKKEDERINRLVKSGLCPKCGTWCYGDCEA